jgi:quercetin dioxygenase-like cupin family protein/iron-sulfur cluster repair protein YtfE (RIC family)
MKQINLGFQDSRFRPLFESGNNKIVQLSLPANYLIDKHQKDQHLTIVPLSGKVQVETGGQKIELSPANMLVIEPKQEHAMFAIEESIVLMVLMQKAADIFDEVVMEENCEITSIYSNPEKIELIAPELRSFVEDHVEVCKALENAKGSFNFQSYEAALKLIGDELGRHFVYEEEIFFPKWGPYLGGNDVGPVPKLIKEHRKIREMHKQILPLMEKWKSDPSVEPDLAHKMEKLSYFLLKHIEKEDTHLFPMASRLLSAEDKATIAKELAEREVKKEEVIDA